MLDKIESMPDAPDRSHLKGEPKTLDELVRRRLPHATPEELKTAKEHVRGFLRAVIRRHFGDLPLPVWGNEEQAAKPPVTPSAPCST